MTLSIVWSAQARRQLLASLSHIAEENPLAAELVFQRVEKSLRTLGEFPDMGSPAPVAGVRSYPVHKTGHSFDYRVVKGEIRIQRWYRQRQQRLGE
jgi:plasmid stabilization system protein ParE